MYPGVVFVLQVSLNKTGSKLSINKIVKMMAYLMSVAMRRIQCYMEDFEV